MESTKTRLLRYIAIETRADEKAEQTPSSAGQLELGRLLVQEMEGLGLSDVRQDQNGYVYGLLPGNSKKRLPRFALIAHLDTATDLPGKNRSPQVLAYPGGDIQLASGDVTRVSDFPELAGMQGETLITTDGSTLLGADNKAGIAIILTAVERLKNRPDLEHGDIALVFTPDEEIGHGADLLDLKRLACEFAYTVDGGALGEFEEETFNAAKGELVITGRVVHPGSAKNIMVNANLLAAEFISLLPAAERPETTEGTEGFFMVSDLSGSIEKASVSYIIRDHDRQRFEDRKALVQATVAFLEAKHGPRFQLTQTDQYYNLVEKLAGREYVSELALEAIRQNGMEPRVVPVRGGTDGSRLSWRGLPCPNLFTGGYGFHSRNEFVSVEQMEKAVDVVSRIATLIAERDLKPQKN